MAWGLRQHPATLANGLCGRPDWLPAVAQPGLAAAIPLRAGRMALAVTDLLAPPAHASGNRLTKPRPWKQCLRGPGLQGAIAAGSPSHGGYRGSTVASGTSGANAFAADVPRHCKSGFQPPKELNGALRRPAQEGFARTVRQALVFAAAVLKNLPSTWRAVETGNELFNQSTCNSW